MSDYREETYGDRIAEEYDRMYPSADETALELLAELAAGGPALELGIGTGRFALPLVQRGVEVHGIDASEAMVAKLRARPGGEQVPVTIGSFADFDLGTKFKLVYIPFNTFFALLTQEEQVQCFQCVARHLLPGGVFVIEAFVPDVTRFPGNQAVRASSVDVDEARFDVSRHDPVNQVVMTQQVVCNGGGVRIYPVKIRYAWPSELDLMARLAGLVLHRRWGDWRKSAFTAASRFHVSVYGHPSRS